MKKELLKFTLAVFGFFALIEIASLINHHFRFGSLKWKRLFAGLVIESSDAAVDSEF